MATVFNWLSNLVVAGAFETMVETYSYSATFGTYAVLCCIGLAWEYGYVPETRHKQPDDLTVPDLFECGKVPRRCCAWAPGLASVVFGRRAAEVSSAIVEGMAVDPLVSSGMKQSLARP